MLDPKIFEPIIENCKEAESKTDLATPILAMIDVLNDMYKLGVKEIKKGDTKLMVFKFVDPDLYVVNLALTAIILKSWCESKTLDEMKVEMAELVTDLKEDIEGQHRAHMQRHEKGELEA